MRPSSWFCFLHVFVFVCLCVCVSVWMCVSVPVCACLCQVIVFCATKSWCLHAAKSLCNALLGRDSARRALDKDGCAITTQLPMVPRKVALARVSRFAD